MFLIFISLITGFIGMMLGGAFGGDALAPLFGVLGVLSPALFIVQRIYLKLEDLEERLK